MVHFSLNSPLDAKTTLRCGQGCSPRPKTISLHVCLSKGVMPRGREEREQRDADPREAEDAGGDDESVAERGSQDVGEARKFAQNVARALNLVAELWEGIIIRKHAGALASLEFATVFNRLLSCSTCH